MNSTAHLTGAPLQTYRTMIQDPLSRGLDWASIRTLLEALGKVTLEQNGNMQVSRNGRVLVLHPANTRTLPESGEVPALRRFLEQTETPPNSGVGPDPHLLVVINGHEARLYRSEVTGGVPRRIQPHEPEAKPDPHSFFESVAKSLALAGQILVFGGGTGKSAEMDQFVAWLKTNHPELASRVIGAVVVEDRPLTEEQLLAKAREFYATLQPPVSP